MDIAQYLSAVFAGLAAWAWMKSAFLQVPRLQKSPGWLDKLLNRISTEPAIWNAIAAGLTAVAAVFQMLAFLSLHRAH